jgi:membrane protein required for colicin V production
MLLDILIAVPIIFFTLIGFRDGIVRKLVAIVIMIGGLFAGQIYQHDAGEFLVDNLAVDPSHAPMLGYLAIFFGLILVQALVYRLAAGKYKIGGFADHVIGCVLGFAEGVLFVSAVLLILLPTGFPERGTSKDSRFYKSVVNIAPQILDVESSVNPESVKESLEIPAKKQKQNKETK